VPPGEAHQYGPCDVRSFGAAGDGKTIDTLPLQRAIDACHEQGGGAVYVPAGTYLTGTLYLKSHVTLHLSAGATLMGSTRREDYNADDVFPENPVFTTENATGAHLIIAYREQNVAIVGEGTIDGSSAAFFEPLPPEEVTTSYRRKTRNFPIRDWRPGQMVFFCLCRDVAVRDVALCNAPYWTLLFLGCERAQVRGLRIQNPPQTANGDGIDIDCCADVTVSDCLIQSGDDCITLRGNAKALGEAARPCEHVVVQNCVLSTPCNAIRIGVGDGVVRDCSLSNIIVKDSRTGISIVSAYSARSAHGTTLDNIHLSDFTMDTVMPINMLLGPHARPPAAIRNLSFSHFSVLARQGCYFGGNPGHPITDIRLHEVDLRLTGDDVDPAFTVATAHPGGGVKGVPAGLFISHVDGLRATGLRVRWQEPTQNWLHAVRVENSHNVDLGDVQASPPPHSPDSEAVHRCG